MGKFAGFRKLSGTVAKQKRAGITIQFSSARTQSSSQEAFFAGVGVCVGGGLWEGITLRTGTHGRPLSLLVLLL